MFPQCFPVYHTGNIVSTVSFSKMEICLCFMAGNFNENPSMRAVAKILRARASEYHLVIFASNPSKHQILRALSNWMEPFDTSRRLGGQKTSLLWLFQKSKWVKFFFFTWFHAILSRVYIINFKLKKLRCIYLILNSLIIHWVISKL